MKASVLSAASASSFVGGLSSQNVPRRSYPLNELLFGTSTSAHQIEGGLDNNWSRWSKNKDDVESAGNAVNHYNTYKKDYKMAADIGHNALRLSVPWSRIMPDSDTINYNELRHYKKRVKELRSNDIEPVVSLWHFSHPKWFMDKGGWVNGPVHKFDQFVREVVDFLKDDVRIWVTLNEPQGFAAVAYGAGIWPNYASGIVPYLKAEQNMVTAHKRAKEIIDSKCEKPYVGSAITYLNFVSDGSLSGHVGSFIADQIANHRFVESISDDLDFMGINYYFHNEVGMNDIENPKELENQQPHPNKLESVLKKAWRKHRIPMIVTETGTATGGKRGWYVKQSVEAMMRARGDGVPVNGYLLWTLLDCYEWHSGWGLDFGLIEADRNSTNRIVRESVAESFSEMYTRYADKM